MKFIVTGGAGFIGSALVRLLIDNTGHQVLNIDKLTYAGHPESLASVDKHPRYRFARADICDADAINRLVAEFQPDKIVHLAAESHVDRSVDGPAEFIQTNIIGTFNLLQAARAHFEGNAPEHFLFHHVSTDEVFGSLGEAGYFTEDSRYDPRSPYSASKAASDHLVRAWGATYGLPVIVTNCSNNYGPRQFPEKLIPLTLMNALRGKPLPVYGGGGNVRDWLYVEDHARALHLAVMAGRPGRTYNIGGKSEQTNLAVVNAICELLQGLRPPAGNWQYRDLITHVADRPGHDFRYAIDTARIERELGWQPRETFASGLQKTVVWYLDNPAWCEAVSGSGWG